MSRFVLNPNCHNYQEYPPAFPSETHPRVERSASDYEKSLQLECAADVGPAAVGRAVGGAGGRRVRSATDARQVGIVGRRTHRLRLRAAALARTLKRIIGAAAQPSGTHRSAGRPRMSRTRLTSFGWTVLFTTAITPPDSRQASASTGPGDSRRGPAPDPRCPEPRKAAQTSARRRGKR